MQKRCTCIGYDCLRGFWLTCDVKLPAGCTTHVRKPSATHYNTLQKHCSALQHSATLPARCYTCRNTLRRPAILCNPLQCTATFPTSTCQKHSVTLCNTLHCTATRCNALQRTTTLTARSYTCNKHAMHRCRHKSFLNA